MSRPMATMVLPEGEPCVEEEQDVKAGRDDVEEATEEQEQL